MQRIVIVFLLLIIPYSSIKAAETEYDEYSFDVEEFTPKRFEINYRLDLRPNISYLDASSRSYKLLLESKNKHRYQDNFNLLAGTYGSYKVNNKSKILFDGLLTHGYVLDTLKESQTMNEGYLRYDYNKKLQINFGKKTFKWGKGYSWNPVNFAGRQKDLNDIDLALAGYTTISSQYIRSLSGYLSNITLTTVLLPVTQDFNHDFTENSSINVISQLYLLLGNTDVDFYFMGGSEGKHKVGADFSKNLRSNWEVHGEVANLFKYKGYKVNATSQFIEETTNKTNLLLGTRYLDKNEITYILEYLHNGTGFNDSEMNTFYNFADTAIATSNLASKKIASQNFGLHFNKQFYMKDYFYMKASKPELFNNLYLNGSIMSVYNIADASSLINFEVNFTGKTDQIMTLRFSKNIGSNDSEFGQKNTSDKVEIRCQYFF